MIEIILCVSLVSSLVANIILATKKTPILQVIEENKSLRNQIDKLQSQLDHSEKRRKNLLSVNKGERLLLTSSLTFGRGTKDEINFTTNVECDVIEVTDKKVKVSPYRAITDSNDINSDQSRLKGIIDFYDQKWVDISDTQPILDTQVRREDKLEELADVL